MEEVTQEMKDLAQAAAAAYVTGLRINGMEDAINQFLDAYEYAIKKICLKEHKDRAMKDIVGDSSSILNSSCN